jgi:glycosyltransferase involved in cell wall biosynthesis
MNLAIFSPSQNPYSETFIQAHKSFIRAERLYYIFGGGFQNMQIENDGPIISHRQQLWLKGKARLTRQNFKVALEHKIALRLKELKVDVALIEYGTHAMKLIPVLKQANIPFVVHFHGYDASIKIVLEKHHNYKQLFAEAYGVIAVSKVMYKRLLDLGCPKEKLVYNVYGANPLFKKRQPQFSKKQAVAIGRFVDKKAPYYTIMAFKHVVKKYPSAQLKMAGQGVLMNTCSNLIKYLGLQSNIQLLGIVTPEEVAKLMQESYCFVQHSITADDGDQEGTPLAVLEAALSGLPVVSTYHAGIQDVIKHGETGLLCDEHDVDKMAENLIRIFDDVDYAKQLGHNAREDHMVRFSLERHINSLEETLRQAMQSTVIG